MQLEYGVLRSENNLRELVLSFQHVSLGDRTQVPQIGCKTLYLLSHLHGPV